MTLFTSELTSTIVLSFIVTLTSASGICQAPSEDQSSYGKMFVIPFPNVNTTISATFEYRVYVTNPNSDALYVTMTSGDGAASQTMTVDGRASIVLPFNSSYMMIGQGKFKKSVTLMGDMEFGVHVLATEKMDGYTSHPVDSWGSHYRIVTHCGFDGELCQLVIVVNQTSQVKITLPGQGENTISYVATQTPTSGTTFDVTIAPGEVYQLQRTFDITGAQITSDVSIGVLSGAANATVRGGATPGAFLEHMPPVRSAGTEFIVPRTPGQPGVEDYVRMMALQDSTTVFTWSDAKRFTMNSSQYITRRLNDPLMLVESDRPLLVVKFSQADTASGQARHPTMTVIVPTSLFLKTPTFFVTQVTDATEQYVIVVKSNTSTDCDSQLTVTNTYSIPSNQIELHHL